MSVLVSVAAAAAAGCATTAAPSYPAAADARFASYARATSCCDDPSTFQYQQLPERGYAEAAIGTDSPAFDFHSGMSPFAAFELPAARVPYRLRVKSLFGEDSAAAAGVFYPVVAMLDDAYIVIRMSSLDSLRVEPSLATPGGETGLAITVPVDPSAGRERYMVVFTPAAILGATPPRRDGDVLTSSSLAWLERRGEAIVPPSPYGQLRITVAPEIATADASATP